MCSRTAPMLHTGATVRALLLSIVSMSCSFAGSGDRLDASVHDSHLFLDAPGQPIDGHGSGTADAPVSFTDAAAPCKQPNLLHGDGKHNPTMDCMGGCHDHGFSLAGTLFQADLVTPAANATVTVVDANNFSQDIIVSTNGNFFSFLPVTYPIRIGASLCPSSQAMVTHPTSGACNATGCHEPGGVQGLMHL